MKLVSRFSVISILSTLLFSSIHAESPHEVEGWPQKNYAEIDGKIYYFGCLPEKSDEKLMEYLKQNEKSLESSTDAQMLSNK